MATARWRLVVDIYERAVGPGYPVVTHLFYGQTQKEAQGYCDAHLKTDVFFRDCLSEGRWESVDCWHEVRWEPLS